MSKRPPLPSPTMREPPPSMGVLKQKELLPEQHIVDTGYVDAGLLHSSAQDYGIDLIGPTRPDVKWQAQEKKGFAAGQFQIDWQAEQATCPEGHRSISWTPAIDNRHTEVIKIKFSIKDCQNCPSRVVCTHSTRYPRRTITVRREQQHQALQQARARAKTEEFKTLYARRAGVEGTISQGVRAMGLRRSRSIGQEKTHLQHLATAAAMNIVCAVRRIFRKTQKSALTLERRRALLSHELALQARRMDLEVDVDFQKIGRIITTFLNQDVFGYNLRNAYVRRNKNAPHPQFRKIRQKIRK